MFTGLICIPALAYWKLGLNSVLAFWIAYVLTRPLGASYADWLGVPHRYGGVGLGRGVVALILSIVIVGFVAFLAVTRKDVTRVGGRAAGRPRPAPPVGAATLDDERRAGPGGAGRAAGCDRCRWIPPGRSWTSTRPG